MYRETSPPWPNPRPNRRDKEAQSPVFEPSALCLTGIFLLCGAASLRSDSYQHLVGYAFSLGCGTESEPPPDSSNRGWDFARIEFPLIVLVGFTIRVLLGKRVRV